MRQQSPPESFGYWLQRLPLKPGLPAVRLHDGRAASNQEAHAAVIDIDVGTGDLQQCADAVIRLRGEYLYAMGMGQQVSFDFTSGDEASFRQWSRGFRPTVHGNRVQWTRSTAADDSYAAFRQYLRTVFTYAGTMSLRRQLTPVADPSQVQIGDVFIQGGSPGHAVIVVDVAIHPETQHRVFLLAQSYMPAQDVHVLKNPHDGWLSPWYSADMGSGLHTPQWEFARTDLRRFP